MSEKAISIVARKSAAAAILNGDDLSNGLLEFDPGMSLLQELAKAVMAGDADRTGLADDVRAMLRDGAAALKADRESGTAGLIGAASTLDTLDLEPPDAELVHAAPVTTPVDAPAALVSTPPIVVDLPLLACVAGSADPGGGTSAPKTDAEVANTTDDPVQLSLFGDPVAVPAKRPRRTNPASTRGFPAAA
jgi:hypothetical protein